MLMKLGEGRNGGERKSSSFLERASSNRVAFSSPTDGGSKPSGEDPVAKERRVQCLKDFLSALQGVQGHYLRNRVDPSSPSSGTGLTRGEMAILDHAFELGKLHLRVRGYANRLISEISSGLVCQRLGHALRDELDGFDRFLSILEDSAFRDEGRVHLAQLHAWSAGVMRRLEIMVRICEATEALRGGALVSALYAQTCIGNGAHAELANRLLYKAFQPIEAICKDFVETGRLQLDSHSEFFVTRRKQKPSQSDGELSVYDEFDLNEAMIPTFLGKEFALRVLRTGCESKIERKLNRDRAESSSDAETDSDFSEDGEADQEATAALNLESKTPSPLVDIRMWYQQRLERHVDRVERKANQSILDSLFKEHQLHAHLFALKQFILLGQGDFGQLLVELTASTLGKPVEEVSRMELLAHLEHAIQYSNGSGEIEDVLARLDVQLLEDSVERTLPSGRRARFQPAVPLGNSWDLFTLDYIVTFPLNLVITDRFRRKYRRIFQFLWRVKRVQYHLEVIWKTHSSMTRREVIDEVDGDRESAAYLSHLVHRSHLVRAEMVHFLATLRSYVMFEVLETSWEQFKVDLDRVSSLGELLEAHETFLKSVVLKAMIIEDEEDDADAIETKSLASPGTSIASASPSLISAPSTARKYRPSASKSPLFSLRSSDATLKETKGLSIRLDHLFELMLRFCALQERLFLRIQEQRQARALRRRQQADLARRRKWLSSSGAARSKVGMEFPSEYEAEEEREEEDEELEDDSADVVAEYQSQVEAVSTEFWQSLNAFLSSLKSCSSENLRFLGLRLNFNHYY